MSPIRVILQYIMKVAEVFLRPCVVSNAIIIFSINTIYLYKIFLPIDMFFVKLCQAGPRARRAKAMCPNEYDDDSTLY